MATASTSGKVGYPWHTEYREIREAISQLCAGFSPEYWDEHERDSVFPEEFFQAFATGGWLGATVPEQYGGSGLPLSAMAAILEVRRHRAQRRHRHHAHRDHGRAAG